MLARREHRRIPSAELKAARSLPATINVALDSVMRPQQLIHVVHVNNRGLKQPQLSQVQRL